MLPEEWEERLATVGQASVEAIETQLQLVKQAENERGFALPLQSVVYETIGGYFIGIFANISSMYEISTALDGRVLTKWYEILAFRMQKFGILRKPRSFFTRDTPAYALAYQFGAQDAENFYRRYRHTDNYDASLAEFSSLAGILLATYDDSAGEIDPPLLERLLVEIGRDSGALGRGGMTLALCTAAAHHLCPDTVSKAAKQKADDEIARELRLACFASIEAVDAQIELLRDEAGNSRLSSFEQSEIHCALIVFYTFGIFYRLCEVFEVDIYEEDVSGNRERWYEFLQVIAPKFTRFPLSEILPDENHAAFFEFCSQIGSRDVDDFGKYTESSHESYFVDRFEPAGLMDMIFAIAGADGGVDSMARQLKTIAKKAGAWGFGSMDADLCYNAAQAICARLPVVGVDDMLVPGSFVPQRKVN